MRLNKLALLSCIVLMFLSCKKIEGSSIKIELIGHAGMGLNTVSAVYHNNSKESIQMALSTSGVNAVEIDVQLSKSGSLWAYHDNKLEHSTYTSGCIASLTDEELSGG